MISKYALQGREWNWGVLVSVDDRGGGGGVEFSSFQCLCSYLVIRTKFIIAIHYK